MHIHTILSAPFEENTYVVWLAGGKQAEGAGETERDQYDSDAEREPGNHLRR